jgi:hypothetical protein
MPTSFNKDPNDYRLGWIGIVGIFVIPAVVVIAMVTILILNPSAVTQISNAVEAEFATAQAPAPVQPSPSVHAAVKVK